jgi:hypothetical protein
VTSTPPVEPIDERPTLDDFAFAAECLTALNDIPITKSWQFGTAVVTRTAAWGLVWRADFAIPGESLAPLVNRVVCWKDPDGHIALMFAIGQNVPPLS